MSILDAIGLIDVVGQAAEWFASPWRYLLSPGYRAKKHGEWNRRAPIHFAMQLIGGIAGGILGVVLAWFLVLAAWDRT